MCGGGGDEGAGKGAGEDDFYTVRIVASIEKWWTTSSCGRREAPPT
jgi:hypothetical protein